MAGKMEVRSREKAGQMISKLSKGEIDIPQDTAQAKALLEKNGIIMTDYTEIVFVVDTDTKKHFIVPAEAVIRAAQKEVDEAEEYHKMTAEQERMYVGRFVEATPEEEKPTKQEFFDFRVGDYSSSHCA
jgi:hypothetical protein